MKTITTINAQINEEVRIIKQTALKKSDEKKHKDRIKWLKDIREYLEMNPTEEYLKRALNDLEYKVAKLKERAVELYPQYVYEYKKKITKYISENGGGQIKGTNQQHQLYTTRLI